jgi:carboxypeptidase family protein
MHVVDRQSLFAFLALGALVATAPVVARAQQGTVAGRVTDQASGQPLVGARITIVGTSLVSSSRAEGRYQIPNVPPGQVTVRATLIG